MESEPPLKTSKQVKQKILQIYNLKKFLFEKWCLWEEVTTAAHTQSVETTGKFL